MAGRGHAARMVLRLAVMLPDRATPASMPHSTEGPVLVRRAMRAGAHVGERHKCLRGQRLGGECAIGIEDWGCHFELW